MCSLFNYEDYEKSHIQGMVNNALTLPAQAISYYVTQELSVMFKEKALLQGVYDYPFSVKSYSTSNQCTVSSSEQLIQSQFSTDWDWKNSRACQILVNGSFEIEWQGNQLTLILLRWREGDCSVQHFWLLADTDEIARDFHNSVCKFNSQTRGDEVWLFQKSRWIKDSELLSSIRQSSFDSLVLPAELKEQIQSLTGFFDLRDHYTTCNVPWKRGALLIGPPGNGKTFAIKALINALGRPSLYVKSFNCSLFWGTSEDNIQRVFERARELAPCVLVLEDLDSLITPENRSVFLNEMDGFAANDGLLILATTNHPENIDEALLNRHSRFDDRLYFELPEVNERRAYIRQQIEPMHLSDSEIEQIAEKTEGFSYASLKELILSSTIECIKAKTLEAMYEKMLSRVELMKNSKR